MNVHSVRAGLLASLSVGAILAAAGRQFADANVVNAEKIAGARERQAEIMARCDELQMAADGENRALTKAEQGEIDELTQEFDDLQEDCGRRQAMLDRSAALAKPNGRKTAPGTKDDVDDAPAFRPAAGSGARDMGNPIERTKNHGFKTQGEFFKAVAGAAKSRMASVDERLRAAAAGTISVEGVGADGGFAVPPEYRDAILERALGQDSLFGRADPIPIGGSSVNFPADMTTPWDTSGGIQAYWTGETDAITQSKVKLEGVTADLHQLSVLVPVSERLLEDAPALSGYIERKAPEKIGFKLDYAMVWGSGAGMPLGFMNAACLVSQAAEGAQTTDTINATNVVKMFSRMPANLRSQAIWLIHPDAEPQLPLMTLGQQPVYLPPGGLRGGDVYGSLLGRPVIPHEVCETVGDLGDIMFIHPPSFLAIRKASGIKAATSIHLWFDQDLTAFKFVLRAGGQPWWSAAITPRDGSSTRSPFVTLASR